MTEFNKAIVAAIMAILVLIDQIWGISFPHLSEEWITGILVVLTPILVWLVPNKPTEHARLVHRD